MAKSSTAKSASAKAKAAAAPLHRRRGRGDVDGKVFVGKAARYYAASPTAMARHRRDRYRQDGDAAVLAEGLSRWRSVFAADIKGDTRVAEPGEARIFC